MTPVTHQPPGAASPVPLVVWGTAHLYGLVDVERSHRLLDAAWYAGLRRFDTAPLYGHGRSERELGVAVRGARDACFITTKVGLSPTPVPMPGIRLAKAVARRLPSTVQDRARAARRPTGPPGNFSVDHVRRSVDASLARLGRIDRLVLHEVHPEQVTDELLDVLRGYLETGGVGQLGVATRNELTGPAIARAPSVLTVTHTGVGPLAPPPSGPRVKDRVGHGMLGPAGSHLSRLTSARDRDPALARRWAHAVEGTEFAGSGGLTRALFVRATTSGATELLLATSRLERVGPTTALLARPLPLPPAIAVLLAEFTEAART